MNRFIKIFYSLLFFMITSCLFVIFLFRAPSMFAPAVNLIVKPVVFLLHFLSGGNANGLAEVFAGFFCAGILLAGILTVFFYLYLPILFPKLRTDKDAPRQRRL